MTYTGGDITPLIFSSVGTNVGWGWGGEVGGWGVEVSSRLLHQNDGGITDQIEESSDTEEASIQFRHMFLLPDVIFIVIMALAQ